MLVVREGAQESSQSFSKAGPVAGGRVTVMGMENRPPASSSTAKIVGGTSWKDMKAKMYSTGK